jgi:hypothetical protein
MVQAIGVFSVYPYGLGVARNHADDGGLQRWDDGSFADLEFERIAAYRRIELCAVIQGAGVVQLYSVAGFRTG